MRTLFLCLFLLSPALASAADCSALRDPAAQLQCNADEAFRSTYLEPLPEQFYTGTPTGDWLIYGFASLYGDNPVCVATLKAGDSFVQVMTDQTDATMALFAHQDSWHLPSAPLVIQLAFYDSNLKSFRSSAANAMPLSGDSVLIEKLDRAELRALLQRAIGLAVFIPKSKEGARVHLGDTRAVFTQLDACAAKFKTFGPPAAAD